MTDHPDQIRYARRWTIRQPGHDDIHGVQLPSGRVIYDQPGIGLEAAISIDHVRTETPDATVHWAAPDEPKEPTPAETCCVCGGGSVTRHDHRDRPFCHPCASCGCGRIPCIRTGINDSSVSKPAASDALDEPRP